MTNIDLFLKRPVFRSAVIFTLVMALLLAGFTPGLAAGTPYTTIVSVNPGVSVTITGYNFPADQPFTVRMGVFGTLGIGGVVVGTKQASASTTFTETYSIPAELADASKIAIRFDSAQGYYAYDWFENKAATATPAVTATAGPTPTPGATAVPNAYQGPIPTISITGVEKGLSVTLLTDKFPANQTFTVRMGEYGTLGIGGTVVGTLESGTGGALTQTFNIPAALADRTRIAIRLDSNLGYYSYNWFMNDVTFGSSATTPTATLSVTATAGPTATPGVTATPAGTETPAPATATAVPLSGPYTGIPTFLIASVVKDQSVTISATNFPPNQTFTVRMGEFGTLGIGGTEVATYETGAGGSFNATYSIPAALAGRYKIAIRLESSAGYYYAFNWFYNN